MLCQAKATRFTEAWTTFATVKSWAYRQDRLPNAPDADIPDLAAVEVNFGKDLRQGSLGINSSSPTSGWALFLAGLRDYFRTPRFKRQL